RLGPGARADLAGQAAERFYRAAAGSGPARVRTSLVLGPGAALAWLPQEGILFDGTRLDRATSVEMAGDARFLGVEQLVLGRAAMGERVSRLWLRDLLRLRREGRLVLHDALRVDGEAGPLGLAAAARGARAFATVVLAAPDAEARVAAARALLAAAGGVEAGVSGWDGVLLARVLAPSGAALRGAVTALLQGLRDGRTLPRVWSC
ncbi:MAG: urease accessory protein UreD, partial [Janthinobacterium lividum]